MSTADLAAVVARTQATFALVTRAQVEEQLALGPERAESWTGALDRLERFVDEEGLDPALVDEERVLLALPWGGFPPADVKAATWRIEGLAVLLFALSKLEALPAGREVDAEAVHAALPLFAPRSVVEAGARLRPAEELDRLRRSLGVWRWRAKTELIHRQGGAPSSGEDYEAMVARAAERAHAAGLVELVEGDLACGATPFGALSSEALRTLATVVLERGRAADWLCGKAAWDAPPVL